MFVLDVVSRILHVTCAIALVGGSMFTVLALLPGLSQLDDETKRKVSEAITGRWKRVVHVGILLFLLTGFYNYYRATELHQGDGPYHMVLGIKMLLAFAIFFLASALVGRSAKMQSFRDARQRWTTVMIAVALVVVGISGFLKIRGVPPTEAEVATSAESENS